MTLDLIKPNEMYLLWLAVSSNPKLHMSDDGPQDFQAFVEHIANEKITVLAARNGKKFIGVIGFHEEKQMIRGIHFIKDVRGTGAPFTAVMALLTSLYPNKISLRYFADNPYMPSFARKLGGEFLPITEYAMRGGQPVGLQPVEFNGNLVK